MAALDLIDAQVRDTVRRRGLDPASDPDSVRRVVDEVVRAYDDRSLSGAVPALDDVAGIAQDVFDAVAGFGPLQRYLDDDTVEEIWTYERLTDGFPAGGERAACNTVVTVFGPQLTVAGECWRGGLLARANRSVLRIDLEQPSRRRTWPAPERLEARVST